MRFFRWSRTAAGFVAVLSVTLVAGCGSSGGSGGGDPKTLVVATHDSWAMSKDVLADFKKKTGITVKVQPQGDAGELTNRLVLTKDSPLADGVYGIDNTFASRAVDEGVLSSYVSKALPTSAEAFRLSGEGADKLTPVDYGDVCVNVDDTWFAAKGLTAPKTLDDLTKPAYKHLFVTPGATTSSPGLAFLLATIGAEGDGWQAYWKKLMRNDTLVTAGWTDAYEVDFTAGGGKGDRPIVT
ncbi:MAG: thiamine ABC transporter substrate-binding protein, partial [Marmoricola sp.]